MIYLIIAFITLTTYLAIVTIKYGVQKSISFSDVIAEKPYKWFFEITMYICGLILFLYAYSNDMLFLEIGSVFVFMIGLFPLGDTPKWVKIPHITVAILGFSFNLLSLFLDLDHIYPLLIIVTLSVFGGLYFKNKIWATELIIAYGIFISLILTN